MASTLEYAGPSPDAPPPESPGLLRPRGSIPLLLTAVYLPYCWILSIDYPWNSYRLLWLKLWPILPGVLSAMWFDRTSRAWGIAAMGVTTALVLVAVVLLFSRPRRVVWVILTAALVFVLSDVNAVIAHALFRM